MSSSKHNVSRAQVFFDSGYYSDLYQELQNAQKEVIVQGFVMQFDICFEGHNNPSSCFFEVMLSLLKRHVRVYLLLWENQLSVKVGAPRRTFLKQLWERLTAALPDCPSCLGYLHTLVDEGHTFNGKREKIKDGGHRWSQHIKVVVVDRQVAYVGGIDLANQGREVEESHIVPNGRHPWKRMWNSAAIDPTGGAPMMLSSGWVDRQAKVVDAMFAQDVAFVVASQWQAFCVSRTSSLFAVASQWLLSWDPSHSLRRPCQTTSLPPVTPWQGKDQAAPLGNMTCGAYSTCEFQNTICLQRPDEHAKGNRGLCHCLPGYTPAAYDCRDPFSSSWDVKKEAKGGSFAKLEVNGGPFKIDTREALRQITTDILQTIEDAKSFIFIENQYFASKLLAHRGETRQLIKNPVAAKLIERLEHAIQKNETFSIIIALPFKTGFMTYNTAKTLFYTQSLVEDLYGIVPEVQRIVQENRRRIGDKKWTDYVSVIFPSKAVTWQELQKAQKECQGRCWFPEGFKQPFNGANVYFPFLHAKGMVADFADPASPDGVGYPAGVGSANLADRSLSNTKYYGDAEMSVLITGKGAREYFEHMQRFWFGDLLDTAAGSLATAANDVAVANSEVYVQWLGLDFVRNLDVAGPTPAKFIDWANLGTLSLVRENPTSTLANGLGEMRRSPLGAQQPLRGCAVPLSPSMYDPLSVGPPDGVGALEFLQAEIKVFTGKLQQSALDVVDPQMVA